MALFHAAPPHPKASKTARITLANTGLPGEFETEFFRLGAKLNARFKPRESVESTYVQRMPVAQWRYLRVWNPLPADLELFPDLHDAFQEAYLLPCENRLLRQHDQAVAKITELRASLTFKNFGTNPTSDTKTNASPRK